MTEHLGAWISAWLDGELDDRDADLVTGHLEVCPACALERDEVQASRTVLRGLSALDPPAGTLLPRPAIHLGDALSALLDGELDPREAEDAAVHLEACPACTAELAEVGAARDAMRSLPLLEPAASDMPRRGGRRSIALAGATAVMLGIGGLVAAAQPVSAGEQTVAGLVAQHALVARSSPSVESVSMAPGSSRRSAPVRPRPQAGVPGELAPDYQLVSVGRSRGRVHARYHDGVHTLSLFAVPAGAQLRGAPTPHTSAVGGAVARQWVSRDGVVVAWSAGSVDYAIVTDATSEDAVAAATSVPESAGGGVVERTRRRCRGLVEVIG